MLGEFGAINVRRAYGNWAKTALKGWGNITGLHSILPVQQFDVVKGKSATDMRMTIDAMDLLYGGRVDGFRIMSSDSDFLPLAVRIKQDGLPVYGFGTAKTAASFQQACSRFYDVAALSATDEDMLDPPLAGEGQRTVDTELLHVLGAAYMASKRDDEGYASLDEVGQRAKAVSSFAARNYGFNRLSELIKAVPNFSTKEGSTGGSWSSACASGNRNGTVRRPFRTPSEIRSPRAMFSKDDNTPETALRKNFWNALDDSPFVMLGLKGVDDDRTRPMTAQIDVPEGSSKDDGGTIYFFASKTDGVGERVAGTARAVATFVGKDHSLFAHIHGNLVEANDRGVVDRLWNPFVAAWYKDGKDDPDLKLLRFDTEKADLWEASKGATLKAAALKALFDVDPGKEHSHEHNATVEL